MAAWTGHVTYTHDTISDPDSITDALERLDDHAAVASIDRNLRGGSIQLSLDAGTASDASTLAAPLLHAALAGIVTRQRAYQLTRTSTFPPALIETRQGPLMSKAAVEHRLAHRDAKPGRRKVTV